MEREKVLVNIKEYIIYLHGEERSKNTIAKYTHDLNLFFFYLGEKEINKEILLEWKEYLMKDYAPASINSMLAAVNSFLDWICLPQYKVKPLKIQKVIFAKPEKELTRNEYVRLVKAAKEKQNERLALLLQTLCATGIRVSELQFITVEIVKIGRADVNCKGKTRTIFLPKELCRLLLNYCKKKGIVTGPVFQTAGGTPLDRSNIWRDMKALCESAGVEKEKVFPHNFRHLFARTYYAMEKDLSRLADLLGHSNISTTRIYTMESGKEHIRQLERMKLVFGKI